MTWYRIHDDGVSLDVLVQPRASRPRLGPVLGDRIKVAVTAPPVDGAANEAVTELLARTFRRRRSEVSITSGLTGRRKTLKVLGVTEAELLEQVSP